jgi:hypothetical protein
LIDVGGALRLILLRISFERNTDCHDVVRVIAEMKSCDFDEASNCCSGCTEQNEGECNLTCDEEVEASLTATAAANGRGGLDDLRDVWPRDA